MPVASARLLGRADAELVAAQFSHEAWERYSHAHLAAVRAGAALVTSCGRPTGRRAPKTVWDMLDVVAPEFARWSGYFAEGAGLRSAIEAGWFDSVSQERAERALCVAEDFVDAVASVLSTDGDPAEAPSRRASSRGLVLSAS